MTSNNRQLSVFTLHEPRKASFVAQRMSIMRKSLIIPAATGIAKADSMPKQRPNAVIQPFQVRSN
jgi:hypothetical protein